MGVPRLHWAAGACLAAALGLGLGQASARQSQNWNQNIKWCVNKNEAYSPDLQISGCTAVIRSGRESQENLVVLVVAFNSRGNAYYHKNDYDRAIADYNEAIRLDPKYALAFNNRCNAYIDKGDYDRAVADCTKAILLDLKNAAAFHNRGNIYKASGDHGRASAAHRIGPHFSLRRREPIQEQLCEANFFTGEKALLDGSNEEAARLFRIAGNLCPRDLMEWSAANAELKALGLKP